MQENSLSLDYNAGQYNEAKTPIKTSLATVFKLYFFFYLIYENKNKSPRFILTSEI